MCDVCGIRAKLHSLRTETKMGRQVNIRACETCWDPDHPQNFLPKFVQNDPQALRFARPDTGLEPSRILAPAGNWVNGQRPTQQQLDERWIAMELEKEQQREISRMQQEAQRLRPRRFL
jgi:hypothetical protein